MSYSRYSIYAVIVIALFMQAHLAMSLCELHAAKRQADKLPVFDFKYLSVSIPQLYSLYFW